MMNMIITILYDIKSCIGLNCCQQDTIRTQEIYVFGCLTLYSIVEMIKDGSIYKAFKDVFWGQLIVDEQVVEECLSM